MEIRYTTTTMGIVTLERIVRRTINNRQLYQPTAKQVRVIFDIVDSNRIFGMVGRCGGGHNTVWADWTNNGKLNRSKIIQEFEIGMDKICGHYEKLEASIMDHGMRDPLLVTCGWPIRRQHFHMPPEIAKLPPPTRLLLEGMTGGSRLWVAQKNKMKVPCIINDFTGKWNTGTVLSSKQEVISYFGDEPLALTFNPRRGVSLPFDPNKAGFHMNGEWSESDMVTQRAPLWVSIMNKYGYYVDKLSPSVQKLLADAGVVQPKSLRQKFNNSLHGGI